MEGKLISKEALFSLYVGDLDPTETEEQLIQTFSSVQDFHSAVLCKDALSGLSLCYGYVNYTTLQSATAAIDTYNHGVVNGKAMRVMWSQPNSEARTSGIGNVFVKNLHCSIDNLKLHQMFIKHGKILSCKVAVSKSGKTKGHGYVQYDTQKSARDAIEKLNGQIIEGRELYVAHFIRRNERIPHTSFTNLYIKNFEADMTEEILNEKFSKYGKITSLVISKDVNGASRGFAFVNFERAEDAMRAKESMDGTQIGSKVIYVARAQRKAERRQMLRLQFQERAQKGLNLYCKNINDDVDDMQLKAYFSHCGTITSAKVMRTDKGISRGFGFVCFSKPEEANRAINRLNGVMFRGKPLYVSKAQSKEERKKYLKQVLYQKTAISNFTGYKQYHRGPPPLQLYQPPHFNFGWRPNGFNPLVGHKQAPLLPMLPNPTSHYGNIHQRLQFMPTKYPTNLRWPSQRSSGVTNNMITNGHRPPALTAPFSSQDLSSLLAAASPDRRKEILGLKLSPVVKKLKNNLSPKIMEMLLEMDNSELLALLESPESLAAKVEEAMYVLELKQQCNPRAEDSQ